MLSIMVLSIKESDLVTETEKAPMTSIPANMQQPVTPLFQKLLLLTTSSPTSV